MSHPYNNSTDQPVDTVNHEVLGFRFTDWHQAWSEEPEHIDWLHPHWLERGTANVLYSDAGVGKSLVTTEVSASIAQAENVIYLDSENSIRNHRDRLAGMGYGPADLERLLMFSYPDLPPLDTAEGGQLVLKIALMTQAALVVFDTVMRFLDGRENDADTFNQFYRHTMMPLKREGVTSLRLDHEGKDGSRGQRGSIAKRGDVDTVYRLTHPQQGASRYLDREKDRGAHCPARIRLEIAQDPFRHIWHPQADETAQPGDCGTLAEHGITAEWTVRRSAALLREKGVPMSNTRITQALKQMRAVPGTTGNAA